MRDKLRNFAKEPLIQFLLIGACIYGAYAWFGTPDEDVTDNTIIVDAARIDSFIGQWQRRWNRPPTRRELDGVINAFVREDILYRAALAMGLDQDDPITRRRMAQKLEFLTNDIALFKEPVPGELERYFEDNQARYRDPDLITFSQVFFDPDAREDATLDDAAEMLAQLQVVGEPDPATLTAGDRFMLQNYFSAASELEVRRQLGTGFTEAVMQLEPGQWHGPVLSGFGVHLVYVYQLAVAPAPEFEDVQQQVLENWQSEQQEDFNETFFESLKSRYEIVIAEPPAGAVLEISSDSGAQGPAANPAS
ncbi:MAG: peptidyl-prolyl cis-trans isomerase [Gammaproteobacteria bacterium]|nr:MAG: peptidyl-prolyl cis-trans isomerase [Chloroflexota bacterium]TDJ23324.1 MAG: peptidyl-prolyl cis-trans isomerase [Gammaproteobacteria bacterium]